MKQVDLKEKEAKVYLAALELGSTNIQNLSEKSGIKRSTVYEMLKNLSEKGLVPESKKGKRPVIIASEPENLKRNLKSKEQLLNDILSELRFICNIGFIKPRITFYEGKEELKKIYRDTLLTKEKATYWISPIQSINETVGEDFLNRYVEERTKRGIWVKSIHITSRKAHYKYFEPQFHEKTLRKIRFTPMKIDIPDTIAIYDNKVAVMSSRKEGFGFVVESQDYAKTMRVFHDLLWNISKSWHEMNFDKSGENMENNETEEKEDDYWGAKK